MREDTKSVLDQLLDGYDNQRQKQQEAREKRQTEEEAFVADFKRLSVSVIRPVMESIGVHLEARGHGYKVYEEDESVDYQRRTRPARIYMNFYPAGIERSKFSSTNTPSIGFSATTYKRMVSVYGCSMLPDRGGSGGPRGELNLADITPDLVEGKILEIVKETLCWPYTN